MEIIAKWKHNPEYFEQYWNDWIKYRSKGRKHTLFLSFVIGVFGLYIYLVGIPQLFTDNNHGLILIGVGLSLFIWHLWDKQRWIKSMMNDSDPRSEIIMVFNENGITTKSKLSSGEATWQVFKDIVPAKKGIFLILQKGISIYLPEQSLQENNNVDQIIELYNNQA